MSEYFMLKRYVFMTRYLVKIREISTPTKIDKSRPGHELCLGCFGAASSQSLTPNLT